MAVRMSGRRRHAQAGTRPGGGSSRRRRPWVVKVGGRLVEDGDGRTRLARVCADADRCLVLVHGGGDAVGRLQTALGREARFIEGRRVTSHADIEVVEMVLAGAVNKSIVRALARSGRRAVGISGCDADLVRCDLVPGLGRVGTPVEVRPALLETLLGGGWTPVVAPVCLAPGGEPVNVNADELAAAIAWALGAERLLLLSDVEGVQVEDAWRAEVTSDEVEALIASGEATGGMIPKLRAAALATERGVREVRIAGFGGGALAEVRGTRVRARRESRSAQAEGVSRSG
jgi:acetylglutamate kinase